MATFTFEGGGMSAHASPSGGKSPRARRCPECKAELYCIACTGADDPVEEKEFDTVVACMRWFDETYPQYCLVRWHSAMGARMYAKEMQKLKKMGALVGAPDFSLMVPSVDGQWHTLNVEFKQQGNNPNKYPQQVAVGKALKQVGQQYKVVFNLAQFKAAVVTHLEPPPQTTPAPAVSVDLTQEQDKEELTLSESESDDLILIDSPGPETYDAETEVAEEDNDGKLEKDHCNNNNDEHISISSSDEEENPRIHRGRSQLQRGHEPRAGG